MNMSPAGALAASIILLLLTRFLFWANLSSHQSRKAQRRYKAEVPLWNRWLFLSAPDYVQDKYSKLERKVIKARATTRAIRAMNILLHALLAVEALVILIKPAWSNTTFLVWFAVWGVCFLLEVIIHWCNHPNAERVRNGRQPRNW